MASVDLDQAERVLCRAIVDVQENEWQPSSPFAAAIGSVVMGNHLTYRYILVNGLLAKATNEEINPITLQAGSELDGAYDARSLCHKVLVRVEREMLFSRLGGSNEPFLNKPARFTELSENNAVRRGRDKEILLDVIRVLGGIPTSQFAYDALKDAIYFIFQRAARDISRHISRDREWVSVDEIYSFMVDFTSESIEGETCALIGGVIFDVLGKLTSQSLSVIVHPVNQSGASSREISDIDVFCEDVLTYTIEIKDKSFGQQDVDHAVTKAVNSDHNRLIFLTGPQARLLDAVKEQLVVGWADKGVDLSFFDLRDFFKTVITLGAPFTKEEILVSINHHAQNARVKDETMTHLLTCMKARGWT